MSGEIVTANTEGPTGQLLVGAFDGRICMCVSADAATRKQVERRLRKLLNAELCEGTAPIIEEARRQFFDYFDGWRREFELPLLPCGTPFQLRVWAELQAIPYSTTITYAELARRIGSPNAVRAVASACRANPLHIIVPCHRVIGSGGALTGYAAGLPAKRFLLALESRNST